MRLPDRRFSLAARVVATSLLLLGATGCSADGEPNPHVPGWSKLDLGDSGIESILNVPGSPDAVYTSAFSGDHRVFKSTDGGARWSRITAEQGTGVELRAVDPKRPGILYGERFAVVGDRDWPKGLVKSTDDGRSWSTADHGLPHPSEGVENVSVLAVDPTSSNVLYAGGMSGIFGSTNGGESWARLWRAPKRTAVESLAIDPRTPSTLYAGTGLVGPDALPLPDSGITTVLRSIDHGRTWRRTSLRLGSDTYEVTGIAIDARKPHTLYASTSYGFYKSENRGRSWVKLSLALPDTNTSALFPATAVCLACPLLAIDPSRPDTVYVSAEDVSNDVSYVLKTTTGGRSWVVVARIEPSYGEDFPLSSLAVDTTGRYVYGGMEFGDLFVCDTCSRAESPPVRLSKP